MPARALMAVESAKKRRTQPRIQVPLYVRVFVLAKGMVIR